MADPILPQIKNIVFLMLENRSLDNLLGWLYQPPNPTAPDNVFPAGSPKLFEGLKPGAHSLPYSDGSLVEVTKVPDNVWSGGYAVPTRDPYEALRVSPQDDPRAPKGTWKGVMNQLFGDAKTIDRLPTPEDGAPAMLGFLQDYYYWDESYSGKDIAWTFTPAQASVINGLALQYAVSDQWFCSVPSETNPNRAYSLLGTSMGRESNANIHAQEQFERQTIINSLAEKKSWGLYYSSTWIDGKSYTEYTFPYISQAAGEREIGDISLFFRHARRGSLPAFTYLEPGWTSLSVTGNDYHPNSIIQPGEQFILDVYNAVRNGPQWNETLLIITFDEHGGTYDHVAPLWGAKNPDGLDGQNLFKFDLFGVRVPTILVSPFVQPRTVFRAPDPTKPPFDHTSFLKTLLRWADIAPESVDLGQRMPLAQTFEGVFADHPVNPGTLNLAPPRRMLATPHRASAAHPAAAEALSAVVRGVPVVATRAILLKNPTLAGVQAEVARYRTDPAKFEADIKAGRYDP